jgi:hypothetical protein
LAAAGSVRLWLDPPGGVGIWRPAVRGRLDLARAAWPATPVAGLQCILLVFLVL